MVLFWCLGSSLLFAVNRSICIDSISGSVMASANTNLPFLALYAELQIGHHLPGTDGGQSIRSHAEESLSNFQNQKATSEVKHPRKKLQRKRKL